MGAGVFQTLLPTIGARNCSKCQRDHQLQMETFSQKDQAALAVLLSLFALVVWCFVVDEAERELVAVGARRLVGIARVQ